MSILVPLCVCVFLAEYFIISSFFFIRRCISYSSYSLHEVCVVCTGMDIVFSYLLLNGFHVWIVAHIRRRCHVCECEHIHAISNKTSNGIFTSLFIFLLEIVRSTQEVRMSKNQVDVRCDARKKAIPRKMKNTTKKQCTQAPLVEYEQKKEREENQIENISRALKRKRKVENVFKKFSHRHVCVWCSHISRFLSFRVDVEWGEMAMMVSTMLAL